MRKQVFGRRLKRDTDERKALFKGLVSQLVLHGRIKTTEAKAKAIKASIDKLVTKVKRNGKESGSRFIAPYLLPSVMDKFVSDIVPRFSKRAGGYTRIVRLHRRLKDDAEMVLMEWTEVGQMPATTEKKSVKTVVARKTSAKRGRKKVIKKNEK